MIHQSNFTHPRHLRHLCDLGTHLPILLLPISPPLPNLRCQRVTLRARTDVGRAWACTPSRHKLEAELDPCRPLRLRRMAPVLDDLLPSCSHVCIHPHSDVSNPTSTAKKTAAYSMCTHAHAPERKGSCWHSGWFFWWMSSIQPRLSKCVVGKYEFKPCGPHDQLTSTRSLLSIDTPTLPRHHQVLGAEGWQPCRGIPCDASTVGLRRKRPAFSKVQG